MTKTYLADEVDVGHMEELMMKIHESNFFGPLKAVCLAYRFGQIEGNHHKNWVIDQMVRAILKSDYDAFVEWANEDIDNEEDKWDVGISP